MGLPGQSLGRTFPSPTTLLYHFHHARHGLRQMTCTQYHASPSKGMVKKSLAGTGLSALVLALRCWLPPRLPCELLPLHHSTSPPLWTHASLPLCLVKGREDFSPTTLTQQVARRHAPTHTLHPYQPSSHSAGPPSNWHILTPIQ